MAGVWGWIGGRGNPNAPPRSPSLRQGRPSVDRAYLTDDELIYKKGKKTIPVKYQTLHILKTDGSEFSAQAHSSQALDKLVSDINHIKERKAK